MKLRKTKTIEGYLMHKTATSYKLCKILNEYDNKEDADKDLIQLLTYNKTEKELLKDYSKKDIFGMGNSNE